MDRSTIRAVHLSLMTLALTSCVAYEPRPLNPEAIIEEVNTARQTRPANSDNTLTFAQTVRLMRESGPDIKEAEAAYNTAAARAGVSTPLPNPRIQAGPAFGFGPDIQEDTLGGTVGFGLTIPLGGRLSAMDDLNQVRAEAARIETIATCRELYIDLRRSWVRNIAAVTMLAAQKELVESVNRSLATARRLVEAGAATAIDVALFELEGGRAEATRFEASARLVAAQARISQLVGVNATTFDGMIGATTPALPQSTPDRAQLHANLVDGHPNLLRLRAAYEQAEAALRLQIAKQYPDLRIGPLLTDESGEQKMILGLTLGIELPIFDRNQVAVAEATARREEIRVRYESEANRALSQLDETLLALDIARQRHAVLRDRVLPAARRSIMIARDSLKAGSGDVLRLLQAERSYGEILIDVKKALLADCEAWIDVEAATGSAILDLGDTPLEGAREK